MIEKRKEMWRIERKGRGEKGMKEEGGEEREGRAQEGKEISKG